MERIPSELKGKLTAGTKKLWDDLTPVAQRDFASWITSAKRAETRASRAERVPSMLASGKRRPCCYAVVPMGIYKALEANAKAKTGWAALTPDQRRDFADWVGGAKDTTVSAARIKKACALLASGKKRP